jgi:hypothetical protein
MSSRYMMTRVPSRRIKISGLGDSSSAGSHGNVAPGCHGSIPRDRAISCAKFGVIEAARPVPAPTRRPPGRRASVGQRDDHGWPAHHSSCRICLDTRASASAATRGNRSLIQLGTIVFGRSYAVGDEAMRSRGPHGRPTWKRPRGNWQKQRLARRTARTLASPVGTPRSPISPPDRDAALRASDRASA